LFLLSQYGGEPSLLLYAGGLYHASMTLRSGPP